MIYTTYFANLKKLPPNIIPISIAGKAPDGYKGLEYKKLAPKYGFWARWKEEQDNDYYIRCYNDQVLSQLKQFDTLFEMMSLVVDKYGSDEFDIALVCYEKPEDFCHRHLVADWFEAANYEVCEWEMFI